MSKSNSEKHTTLNRRQALLLSATAGMGAVLARPAKASDSTKTAAHQEPGIAAPLARRRRTPSMARCAAFSMAAFLPSRECRMAKIPAAKIGGFQPNLPSRGTASTPL